MTEFTRENYYGFDNLKLAERLLIHKALIRSHGNVSTAYQLLCPNRLPYSSVDYLYRILKRHGINFRHYKY